MLQGLYELTITGQTGPRGTGNYKGLRIDAIRFESLAGSRLPFPAGEAWLQSWRSRRKRFVLADHKDSTRHKMLCQPLQNLTLQRLGKVREDQIAAQDEVNRLGGSLSPNVLLAKVDLFAEILAEHVLVVGSYKGGVQPVRRCTLEAAGGIGGPPRALEHVLIGIGGLNCEAETAAAFRLAGAEPDLVHLTDLFALRTARRLTDYRILCFVAGFAYGDHVAGGFVLATRIRAHMAADLAHFLGDGGLVLGICNGFQTLVRLGLLPGPDGGRPDFLPRASLTTNDRLGYRNAWVTLGVDPASDCAWTRGLSRLEMPARHGEGKLVPLGESQHLHGESRGRSACSCRWRHPKDLFA